MTGRPDQTTIGVLSAALLFIRNHYRAAPSDPTRRRMVLDRIDSVLKDYPPTGMDIETFRDWYPPHGEPTP